MNAGTGCRRAKHERRSENTGLNEISWRIFQTNRKFVWLQWNIELRLKINFRFGNIASMAFCGTSRRNRCIDQQQRFLRVKLKRQLIVKQISKYGILTRTGSYRGKKNENKVIVTYAIETRVVLARWWITI